jgi:hypothetical protein
MLSYAEAQEISKDFTREQMDRATKIFDKVYLRMTVRDAFAHAIETILVADQTIKAAALNAVEEEPTAPG